MDLMEQTSNCLQTIYHSLLLDGIVPEREIEDEVHAIMDTPARLLEFTSSL